jgi:hypothetical protein
VDPHNHFCPLCFCYLEVSFWLLLPPDASRSHQIPSISHQVSLHWVLFCVSSCHFYLSLCHVYISSCCLQFTTELLAKILHLLFSHCLSSMSVLVSSDFLWPAFIALHILVPSGSLPMCSGWHLCLFFVLLIAPKPSVTLDPSSISFLPQVVKFIVNCSSYCFTVSSPLCSWCLFFLLISLFNHNATALYSSGCSELPYA